MKVQDWTEITLLALQNLWQGFLIFLPKLIGALIVFLIGWFIAVVIGKMVSLVLVKLQFDKIFARGLWKDALEKAELKFTPSEFIGAIVKWVLMIVFLLAAVEILGLPQFAALLRDVLNYLPNVVVATLIFVVATIIAEILEKIARTAVEGVKMGYGHLVSLIVKWSIWIFAILLILYQLGIGRVFMTALFQGVVAFLVIAFGLAFGLGGKEVAAEFLTELKKKLKG